jgi:hypothetical protein
MVPFYLVILVGLWLGPAPRAAKMFLAAPAVYFTMAHAVSVGSLRYRIPADVPMAVLVALAAQLWVIRRHRQADDNAAIPAPMDEPRPVKTEP